MRRILIESARRKQRLTRDGQQQWIDFIDATITIERDVNDVLALDGGSA